MAGIHQMLAGAGPAIYLDDFAENSLASYTEYADSPANWAIAGGVLACTTGVQSVLSRSAVVVNGFVSCVITEAHDAGLVLRLVNNNNYYVLVVNDSGATPTANRVVIYKRVGGSYSQVGASAAVSFPRGTPHTVEFRAVGNSLTVKFDGVAVISTTDGDLSAGRMGPRANGGTAKFDSLQWGSA